MRGIAAEREAKRGELGDDRHARLRVVPLPLVHLPRLVQLVVPVLDRILEERALGEVADEALVVDVDAVDFGVDVRGGARPRPPLGLLLLQQDEPLGALGFRDGSGPELREREAGVALQLGELRRHRQPRLGLCRHLARLLDRGVGPRGSLLGRGGDFARRRLHLAPQLTQVHDCRSEEPRAAVRRSNEKRAALVVFSSGPAEDFFRVARGFVIDD